MLTFFFNGSPNPTKVALLLEELGLPYEPVPVDTRAGDQFASDFLALNPNAKVPVIVDEDVTVFDSNAILLYLAERTGRFLPADAAERGPLLSWLMFVATGIGPYAGQAVHFRHFAPEPVPYARERYRFEARRHFGVLNDRLADRPFLLGETYTIVDMSAWGWARMLPFVLGEDVWSELPHLKRHHDAIAARPAAIRAVTLKDRFPFKAEMDAAARAHLFKHLAPAG